MASNRLQLLKDSSLLEGDLLAVQLESIYTPKTVWIQRAKQRLVGGTY
jgi:hypothetical protein